MKDSIEIEDFIAKADFTPVIDVRSPAEYKRGHITGAVNIPLFENEERAEVGTIFHKKGREEAVKKGLDITGPKMHSYIDQVKSLANDGHLLVYCWRGGMRSESMAWLLKTAGMSPLILTGGYKSYRNYLLAGFDKERPLIILGGMTGSGKTEILKNMTGQGMSVIDLESMACHKGSVFGSLGHEDQPAQQQFENDLGYSFFSIDPSREIWLEDESMNIGKVSLPKVLHTKMHLSPLIYIEMDRDMRLERIRKEYGSFEPKALEDLIIRISRRLGGANAKKAVDTLRNGNLAETIRIMLDYYDKKYAHSILKRDRGKVFTIRIEADDIKLNTRLVIDKARDLKLIK